MLGLLLEKSMSFTKPKNIFVVFFACFVLISSSVHSQDRYSILLDAMAVSRQMFAEGVIGRSHDGAGNTQLQPCSDTWPGISHLGVERMFDGFQTVDDRIISVATRIEEARLVLQRAGYPEHVFDQRLDEIAFSLVDRLDSNNWTDDWRLMSADFSVLASELESYRLAENTDLPVVTLGRGCGDGGLVGIVRTDPPGGSVWFASEFDFRLCAHRGEDNMNLNGCGWSQENLTYFSVLGGNYRVFASWPDGTTHFTSINILAGGTNPLYGQYDPILGEENYADFLVTVAAP